MARAEAVSKVRPSEDFESISIAFKRMKNILRQAEFQGGAFSAGLLEAGPERELFDEIHRAAGQPIERAIGALRPKVDLYFDKVLVNAPDPAIRANRLAMLDGLESGTRLLADARPDAIADVFAYELCATGRTEGLRNSFDGD